MARYGKQTIVDLDPGKLSGHYRDALLDKGYEYRYSIQQKNSTEREIYAGPDGKMYAFFALDGDRAFLKELKND